jgi:hypothetical protein
LELYLRAIAKQFAFTWIQFKRAELVPDWFWRGIAHNPRRKAEAGANLITINRPRLKLREPRNSLSDGQFVVNASLKSSFIDSVSSLLHIRDDAGEAPASWGSREKQAVLRRNSTAGPHMAVFFTLTVTAICGTPAGSKGDLSQPIRELAFGGGFRFDGLYGPKVATTTLASLNLTSDPSGIPHFDEAISSKRFEAVAWGRGRLLPSWPGAFSAIAESTDTER